MIILVARHGKEISGFRGGWSHLDLDDIIKIGNRQYIDENPIKWKLDDLYKRN